MDPDPDPFLSDFKWEKVRITELVALEDINNRPQVSLLLT
jgi:hypothetical protein